MNAILQVRSAKSSSMGTERHTPAVRDRAPSRPRQAAASATRPSRLQRFFAALVAALAVPTI